MFAIDMLLFIPTQLTWKLSSKTISWYVVNEILLHNITSLCPAHFFIVQWITVYFFIATHCSI